MQWWHLVGLIGVTMIVSRGKIFRGTRRYLRGFVRWYNPLRMLGEIMHCAMCSGFWVGFLYGAGYWRNVSEAFVLGGCVSLVSWAVGVFLCWFEGRFPNRNGEEDTPEGAAEEVPMTLEDIYRLRAGLEMAERRLEREKEQQEWKG